MSASGVVIGSLPIWVIGSQCVSQCVAKGRAVGGEVAVQANEPRVLPEIDQGQTFTNTKKSYNE